MSRFVSKQNMITNGKAALLYIACAVVSLGINSSAIHFIPIWVPIGLTVSYLYSKNLKILPGIIFASLVSHLLLAFHSLGTTTSFPLMPIFLLSVGEIVSILIFYFFTKRWNWSEVSKSKLLKLYLLLFVTILMPIPLTSAQGWYLFKINMLSTGYWGLVSIFLYNTIGIIVLIPLGLAWFKKNKEKLYESLASFAVYLVLLILLVLVFINNFIDSSWINSSLIYFFVPFAILVYIAISYSSLVYTSTLTFFSVAHLLLTYSSNINGDLTISDFENLLYLIVLVLTAHFLKDKMSLRVKAIDSLKTNYKFVEEEVNRQVEEYRDLNNRLFEEIEKRGFAEKELAQSRRLLSEAQEVSRISTWEYSTNSKKFRWISHNAELPLLGFDLESESLKSIASRVHPDDLKKAIEWNKNMDSQNSSFELEIRIKRQNDTYGYFLVRGKSIFEKNKIARVLGLIMDITERKLSEQILLEKEEKYKALFDSNIDPICVIDAQTGKVSDVNPAFVSVYGYSPDEIIGESYITLSAQPEETRTAIAFGRQIGNYRVTHRTHKKKNGDLFFIEANLMRHQLEGRDMLFIITHDITRRKEAEISLAEREQKFRTFFESDLIGMAEVSIAKEIISFNERFIQILGYSSKEFKAKTWDSITYSEDIALENKLFNQVLTHEIQGYSIEKRFVSKTSDLVQCKVSLKAIRSSQGNISHLIILVDDITERKRFESELRESRTKLSQAQSVAKLGSIRFFPGDNLVSISKEAYEILGYGNKRPTLSRKDFFNIILPSSKGRFEEFICDLENGIKVEGDHEQSVLTPSGEVKYILVNFGLSLNSQNQVDEVLATMADITRIKRAEMELLEANALKDQLLSIIGHDLRSPIGSMNQMIDMYATRKEEFDNETSKSILETLKNTSHETYKLLENLLEWAKSQKYNTYKPEVLDLVLLTEQVLSLSKGIAESKNIVLQSNLPTKAIVMVDKEMIKTALRNLISNSIKFTPQSGLITIDISDNTDSFIISVSDTGVGIAPDAIPKLFDNASSYTTAGTNNEKGSGLGLKLVKKFIEKNGGQINVESFVGQGSKFTFKLPKYLNLN